MWLPGWDAQRNFFERDEIGAQNGVVSPRRMNKWKGQAFTYAALFDRDMVD